MKTHTIEGEWTGYTSSQCRVVHREHTSDEQRIAAIRKLGSIIFTDGTCLLLRVKDGKHGDAIDRYERLISDCIRHNVGSVQELTRRSIRRI